MKPFIHEQPSNTYNFQLSDAIKRNDVDFLKQSKFVQSQRLASELLHLAVSLGHHESLEWLLSWTPSLDFKRPLLEAIHKGHKECVALLVPRCFGVDIGRAAEYAVRSDEIECLKEIIVNAPLDNTKNVLRTASIHTKAKAIEAVIPVSDNPNDHNDALFDVVIRRNTQCIDLLIPVSDCQAVMDRVKTGDIYKKQEVISIFKERLAQHENNIITDQLGDKASASRPSKKM